MDIGDFFAAIDLEGGVLQGSFQCIAFRYIRFRRKVFEENFRRIIIEFAVPFFVETDAFDLKALGQCVFIARFRFLFFIFLFDVFLHIEFNFLRRYITCLGVGNGVAVFKTDDDFVRLVV